MTASERSKILKMIEEGKITPEEGLHLMQVLGEDPEDNTPVVGEESPQPKEETRPTPEPDPGIEKTVERARSLWMIPLWVGVGITVLGSWVLYKNGNPTNAWFYCTGFPILFMGILVIMLGLGSRTARWLFVSVRQKPGEFPKRILIGFPLPLSLTSWFLRNFGNKIEGLGDIPVDRVIDALQQSSEPLVVNVDEGEDGEKVQIFIG